MDIKDLVAAVEAAGVDIAPSYNEYVQLAFAIATDCGEAGRGYFHRLCALSAKYKQADADKLFTNALRENRGDVHLGTAFHLAEQAGVKFDASFSSEDDPNGVNGVKKSRLLLLTRARADNKVLNADNAGNDNLNDIPDEETEKLPGSEPTRPLPVFDEEDWPEPLKSIVQYGSTPAQRDILLLGAVTVLGACLERKVRCLYGRKFVFPCLQTFIIAPPASGKGVLSHLRLLAEPLHNEIRSKTEEAMKAFRQEKSAYDFAGKNRVDMEAPQMPPNSMFFIPGNNTGTGILQNIIDSNGTGLIFETEADTISTAIGSEYGHWSDILRKAFDHENLAYNRRTDREYKEVRKAYLSVLLSGTPAQLQPLIPSAENGLFSRQVFYYMPAIHQWQSQFDCAKTDLETIFTRMGWEWKRQLDGLKEKGIFTLQLTDEQKKEFDTHFAALFHRSDFVSESEMNSSVARLGINICRILSVVAVLRGQFTPDADIKSDNLKDGIITHWDMTVTDDDFHAVLRLAEPLYAHAMHVLSFLPRTEMSRRPNSERDELFKSLGNEFTRKDFLAKAQALGINLRTALTWLKRAKRREMIGSKERGVYFFARARTCDEKEQ